MKKELLAMCIFISGSALAIDNNVELIGNTDFSTNVTPAQTVNGTSTVGVWFTGDNTLSTWNTEGGFIADAATGAFVGTNGNAAAGIFDNFLGQLTTETGVNTGRYHFSISATGDQPFYIKISSAANLGVESTYTLRNASGSAIEKQLIADYPGYSLKITPTGSFVTYTGDIDLTNATASAIRIFIVFPNAGSVSVDDISLKRTKDIPTTYYVRPIGNTTAWTNIPNISDQIITGSALSLDPAYTYYLAPGTYTGSTINVTTGKIYGGLSGNETSVNLSTRVISDKDGNGIVEPWEFTNEAIITTGTPTFTFTQAGISTGSRLLTIQGTGGEVNGVTITDFNFLTFAGPICLGLPSGAPAAINNVSGKEGILRLCTIKKIKSAIGIVMSTNKFSIIDRCLIESNVITGVNTGGAVFLNACGGKVTSCVIRNNTASAVSGRAAGVYATSLASTDMDAIVENSTIYNNKAGANGGAIRGEAQTGKRGIQIINSTLVNNVSGASGASVELISSGAIINSIIVNPALTESGTEIRTNNVNSYISNTVYGDSTYTAGGVRSTTMKGKITSDLSFTAPTTFSGVSIPDFTTPWDANAIANYDAIRQANFKLSSLTSPALLLEGAKSLPANYTTTAGTVSFSAIIPSTDFLGVERPISTSGHNDLGAYQLSSLYTAENTRLANKFNCIATDNGILVCNANGLTVNVYAISGQLIKSVKSVSVSENISLPKGVYIIKSEKFIEKVMIK